MLKIKQILFLEETTSTNDEAARLFKLGAESRTIVFANRQTSGRGRLDRAWQTPDGQIALSILLKPPHIPKAPSYLAMATALMAIDALSMTGIKAFIKWPNDIVIPTKNGEEFSYYKNYLKLGGVLIENIFQNNQVEASIIGLGLNYKYNIELKQQIPFAGFIKDFCPAHIEHEDIIFSLLKSINYILEKTNNSEYIYQRYKNFCITLGHNLSVNSEIQGRAIDIAENGSLIIEDSDGLLHFVDAGDVKIT